MGGLDRRAVKGVMDGRENDWNTLVTACGCGSGDRGHDGGGLLPTGRAATVPSSSGQPSCSSDNVNPTAAFLPFFSAFVYFFGRIQTPFAVNLALLYSLAVLATARGPSSPGVLCPLGAFRTCDLITGSARTLNRHTHTHTLHPKPRRVLLPAASTTLQSASHVH
jgi:hypothetical protein